MISGIWSNVQKPEDVESFALVSKHVYAIGRPFVEEHNKLKKEFSFFEAHTGNRASGPAVLLKEVLLRPRIALYVTQLSMGCFSQSWEDSSDEDLSDDDDEWPNNGHFPYPRKVMALFIKTIRRSSFVPKNKISRWIRSVKEGDEDPIFALLCTLLPNLVVITLRDYGSDAQISQETVLRIAEAEKTVFLTRLVTVNFVGGAEHHVMDWNWLKAFAALPSVQSIHFDDMGIAGYDSVDCHDAIAKAQFLVSENYSIRELTFTNSGFHPKVIAQLLDSVRGLKVFRYVDPNEYIYYFKPLWIRIALLANAKHSLEDLAVLPCSTESYELLGDLRGFTALKELETDVRLLCRESKFDGLAALLPSSIEKLCLDSRKYMAQHDVPRIVEEIVKAKSQLIPNLKTLKLVTKPSWGTVEGDTSMIKSLEEKCQNVGIELKFLVIQAKG